MDDADLIQVESRFRLTGLVAGTRRTFLLETGENRIGSHPDNDIVLRTTGISRHHAQVSIEGTEARVSDLGSKNGIFVNGEKVRTATLKAGDEIGLGPFRFKLVEVGDGEAGMAFVVAKPPEGESWPAYSGGETDLAGPTTGNQRAWLELIDQFASALCIEGEAVLAGALGRVARGLGAEAAVLLEYRRPQQPVVRAAWGHADEDSHQRFRELAVRLGSGDGERTYRSGYESSPSPHSYCWFRDGGVDQMLIVAGSFDPMEAIAPVLRVLLTSVVLARGASPERPARHSSIGPPSGKPGAKRRLDFPEGHVVGHSAQIAALYRELESASQAKYPVLLLGETGVGKEHFARILHLSSKRRKGPFVAINCAAIPAELLESELFGIRKGVATGVAERQGKFELAKGGTLFLDEIGDMPPPLQAKLLRALEASEVEPVGGAPVPIDVRIVAATNVEIAKRVDDDQFRRDLYYRLAGDVMKIPALRERRDDIPLFVEHFLRHAAAESGRHVRGITLRAMRALTVYSWPGNIRELIHEIGRLVYRCHHGEAVDLPLLSDHIVAEKNAESFDSDHLDLAQQTAALERRLIAAALVRTQGNRSQAARLLGISRQGLGMKMERLGIDASQGAHPSRP